MLEKILYRQLKNSKFLNGVCKYITPYDLRGLKEINIYSLKRIKEEWEHFDYRGWWPNGWYDHYPNRMVIRHNPVLSMEETFFHELGHHLDSRKESYLLSGQSSFIRGFYFRENYPGAHYYNKWTTETFAELYSLYVQGKLNSKSEEYKYLNNCT